MFLFESEGDIFSQFAVLQRDEANWEIRMTATLFSQSRHAESEQGA
jgi:hypothetical protein